MVLHLHAIVEIRHVEVHALNSVRHINVMEQTVLLLIAQLSALVSQLKMPVLATHALLETVRDQAVLILLFLHVLQYNLLQTAQLILLHVVQTVKQSAIKQHVWEQIAQKLIVILAHKTYHVD
jgi:hypothetical protein